jgi:hypothetical protein
MKPKKKQRKKTRPGILVYVMTFLSSVVYNNKLKREIILNHLPEGWSQVHINCIQRVFKITVAVII